MFSVSTFSVNPTSFGINIVRVDTNSSWSQPLMVDWIATPFQNSSTLFSGSSRVPYSSIKSGKMQVHHSAVRHNSMVFPVVRMASPLAKSVIAVTVTDKKPSSFFVNLHCVVCSDDWMNSMYLDYVILPRSAIIDNIVGDSVINTNVVTGPFVSGKFLNPLLFQILT